MKKLRSTSKPDMKSTKPTRAKKSRLPITSIESTSQSTQPGTVIHPGNGKVCLCGLQGAGKTYYGIEMVKRNDLKVLVFTPHLHDFKDLPDNFLVYDGFSKDLLDTFLEQAKELSMIGEIDGILIDEFDVVMKNNGDVTQVATDLIANHRHYPEGKGMFIIAMTRRPQDVPTYFFESCKYIICFALQGERSRSKLNGMWREFGDNVVSLDYDSREFYIKEIGKAPVKCSKI